MLRVLFVMYLRLLSLLGLLVLVSCAGQPAPVIYPPAPDWFRQPAPNNAQQLIGVASGSSMQQARANATDNLRQRISQEIAASYQPARQHGIYGSRQQIIQAASEHIQQLTIDKAVLQYISQLAANTFAAQMMVSRQDLIGQLRNNLESRLRQLNRQLQNSRQHSAILREQQGLQLVDDSRQLIIQLAILSVLQKDFPQQAYLDQIQAFANSYQQAKNNLQFTLYNRESSQQALEIFKQAILQRGFKIDQPAAHDGSLRVFLSSQDELSNSAATHIIRISLHIRVLDPANQPVGNKTIRLTGRSLHSLEQAEQDAYHQLEQLIRRHGLFTILGAS